MGTAGSSGKPIPKSEVNAAGEGRGVLGGKGEGCKEHGVGETAHSCEPGFQETQMRADTGLGGWGGFLGGGYMSRSI